MWSFFKRNSSSSCLQCVHLVDREPICAASGISICFSGEDLALTISFSPHCLLACSCNTITPENFFDVTPLLLDVRLDSTDICSPEEPFIDRIHSPFFTQRSYSFVRQFARPLAQGMLGHQQIIYQLSRLVLPLSKHLPREHFWPTCAGSVAHQSVPLASWPPGGWSPKC